MASLAIGRTLVSTGRRPTSPSTEYIGALEETIMAPLARRAGKQPPGPAELAVDDNAAPTEPPPKKPPTDIPRGAYRIPEFARSHGFSRSHYYVLKKLGQAPDETDAGGVPIITIESAKRWRRRRTAASRKP
jgi:hypothetical protein